MSIIHYLGCNFPLPISVDDSDDQILIEELSDEENRSRLKNHFTTDYVYELSNYEGVGIIFNDFNKSDPYIQSSDRKSRNDFLAFCKLLKHYLREGDYCELYTRWVGDEAEDRDAALDQTIYLSGLDMDRIQIYEKTLLVIKK